MSAADNYLARLEALTEESFSLPQAPKRLVLLTGQSSYESSRLSEAQRGFLRHVAPMDADLLLKGFPWHPAFDRPAPRPSLITASGRNARQWFWARYRRRFTAHLVRVFDIVRRRTTEKLFVITGSCGIQFLSAALCSQSGSGCLIDALALGPVGALPDLDKIGRLQVVQGRRDGWSRALWRGPVDCRPAIGHLNYYRDPCTRDYASAFLATGTG